MMWLPTLGSVGYYGGGLGDAAPTQGSVGYYGGGLGDAAPTQGSVGYYGGLRTARLISSYV
jgi:hypothetical protein